MKSGRENLPALFGFCSPFAILSGLPVGGSLPFPVRFAVPLACPCLKQKTPRNGGGLCVVGAVGLPIMGRKNPRNVSGVLF